MHAYVPTSRGQRPRVATIVLAVFGVGLLAPAVVAAAPGDIVAPVNPSASAPVPAIPAATVTANCIVAGQTTSTVWFGYSNTSGARVTAAVGSTSNAVRLTVESYVVNGGQVEQLQPGSVDRAFAVSVPTGDSATWTVTVPDLARPGVSTTVSATGGPSTTACAFGTATRSATIQTLPGQSPSITFTPGKQARNRNGLLTRASVQFSIAGITTTCSQGGVPLEPKVLWGYGGPTNVINGALVSTAGDALAPLSASAIVRTDADANYSFVRSYRSARAIADPQRLWAFGTVQQQVLGTAPFARGLSSETVIADVVARCKFGTRIVSGPTTYWLDADGRPIALQMATDVPTQSTRSARGCILNGSPVVNCDVPIIGVGPGGPRFRL